MDRFIHRANLERYRQLLARTTDEERRRQLLRLLAEEEAKDQASFEKSEKAS
jgi:rubrerythrin